MDNDKFDNEITSVIQKFKDLNSAYEKGKQTQIELNECLALLREELKLARDAERNAEFKKNRCQGFVNQQQEVILKLLGVKEENEKLKSIINKMEKTLSDVQNNSISELVKKDAEINKIKQDYLKELIKIQEVADQQVNKIKRDQMSVTEELKKTITKKEDTIEQQSNSIFTLQTELKKLKEREEMNLEIYQKKLTEQERKHEAELETWKLAELNQTGYKQGHAVNTLAHQNSTTTHYQPGSATKQMNDYRYNMSIQPTHQSKPTYSCSSLQTFQHQPFISRSRNIPPGIVRPTTRQPANNFQKSSDFLSAHDFYLQNQNLCNESEEGKERNTPESLIIHQNAQNQQPKVLIPIKKRKLYNSDQNLL